MVVFCKSKLEYGGIWQYFAKVSKNMVVYCRIWTYMVVYGGIWKCLEENEVHGSSMVFYVLDQGDSPLHLSAQGGSALAFNCLLQHGARLDVVNLHGDRPEDTAKKFGHPLLMQRASELILGNSHGIDRCRKDCEKMFTEKQRISNTDVI